MTYDSDDDEPVAPDDREKEVHEDRKGTRNHLRLIDIVRNDRYEHRHKGSAEREGVGGEPESTGEIELRLAGLRGEGQVRRVGKEEEGVDG